MTLISAAVLAAVLSAEPSRPTTGVLLEDLTWVEAEKVLTPDTVVVIPLGAQSKEHGPHLKLKNDFILAEYLKGRVRERAAVVIAPTVNYSFYPAFVEYPGATSLRLETARDLIVDICRGLARFGPRRFYVLNTGVSTVRALAPAAEALAADGILMRYTDLLKVMEPVEKAVSQQEGGTHADEIETSMILYMSPADVDMSKAVKDYHPGKGGLTRDPKARGQDLLAVGRLRRRDARDEGEGAQGDRGAGRRDPEGDRGAARSARYDEIAARALLPGVTDRRMAFFPPPSNFCGFGAFRALAADLLNVQTCGGYEMNNRVRHAVLLGLVVLAFGVPVHGDAQPFTVVHSFSPEAGQPESGLLLASDGRYYGTTPTGGVYGLGSVYVLAPDGSGGYAWSNIHEFAQGDPGGVRPRAALAQASDGQLYGTTASGGFCGSASVFRVAPDGAITILHSFSCDQPKARLLDGGDGHLYGTTLSGTGSGFGTLYRMDFAGNFETLHAFTAEEGAPISGLTIGSDGFFYGTTLGDPLPH